MEIKFRAPHAIDATCFRSCVCAMAWRFQAIDATLSPTPRGVGSINPSHRYYRGADGVIMVYDITHRESFDHVAEWLAEVNKHASEDCCKLIIGNKTDAPGRAVTTEEAREHADGLGVPFLETSAKASTNVEEAFLTLASELLRRAPPEKPQKKRLSLAASASAKGRKCCS